MKVDNLFLAASMSGHYFLVSWLSSSRSYDFKRPGV